MLAFFSQCDWARKFPQMAANVLQLGDDALRGVLILLGPKALTRLSLASSNASDIVWAHATSRVASRHGCGGSKRACINEGEPDGANIVKNFCNVCVTQHGGVSRLAQARNATNDWQHCAYIRNACHEA